jgi:protein-S-isoprenylcysteine O-methyltransferase Ste14
MLLLVTIRRVIREEEELKKTFGKEWIEYASKTRRFIPGII